MGWQPTTEVGEPCSMVAPVAAGPNPGSLAARSVGARVEEDNNEVGHQFWGSEERGAHRRWLLHSGATW
jgi:hypothetical protein